MGSPRIISNRAFFSRILPLIPNTKTKTNVRYIKGEVAKIINRSRIQRWPFKLNMEKNRLMLSMDGYKEEKQWFLQLLK